MTDQLGELPPTLQAVHFCSLHAYQNHDALGTYHSAALFTFSPGVALSASVHTIPVEGLTPPHELVQLGTPSDSIHLHV